MWSVEQIEKLIVDVPNFPQPGVVFKDISNIFTNHEAFVSVARHFAKRIPSDATKILAIESRGFILASAVAQHLNIGMVLVRKPGKLPRETVSQSYDLEYGQDTLEIHKDALEQGEKVVILDDILATGGTAAAAQKLAEKVGAEVVGFDFLLELEFLKGRSQLKGNVSSLIQV